MPAEFRFRVEIGHHDPRHSPSLWGVRESLDSPIVALLLGALGLAIGPPAMTKVRHERIERGG